MRLDALLLAALLLAGLVGAVLRVPLLAQLSLQPRDLLALLLNQLGQQATHEGRGAPAAPMGPHPGDLLGMQQEDGGGGGLGLGER